MNYFKEELGRIEINGTFSCSVDVFKILEPTYENMPEGYTMRMYIPGKQHTISSGFGFQTIQLSSNWANGDRYIARVEEFILLKQHILKDEIETDKLVLDELNQRLPYNDKRKPEYPGVEELVIALWENIVEKKTKKLSGIVDIQKRREEIKDKYPKGN